MALNCGEYVFAPPLPFFRVDVYSTRKMLRDLCFSSSSCICLLSLATVSSKSSIRLSRSRRASSRSTDELVDARDDKRLFAPTGRMSLSSSVIDCKTPLPVILLRRRRTRLADLRSMETVPKSRLHCFDLLIINQIIILTFLAVSSIASA